MLFWFGRVISLNFELLSSHVQLWWLVTEEAKERSGDRFWEGIWSEAGYFFQRHLRIKNQYLIFILQDYSLWGSTSMLLSLNLKPVNILSI